MRTPYDQNPFDPNAFEILDISQPVTPDTAAFPGDTPFSMDVTATVRESGSINLTRFTMSPHIGTHADAPSHITGDLHYGDDRLEVTLAGQMPLAPFLGRCRVVDVSPASHAVNRETVGGKLAKDDFPPRILLKTREVVRFDRFEDDYAWIGADLIKWLAENGVQLVGIDTPSVDHVESKTLETHHALHAAKMNWLENLDLSAVAGGDYFLIALPLKFATLEASPVRAVLLRPKELVKDVAD